LPTAAAISNLSDLVFKKQNLPAYSNETITLFKLIFIALQSRQFAIVS
jgi:hypothetical protein